MGSQRCPFFIPYLYGWTWIAFHNPLSTTLWSIVTTTNKHSTEDATKCNAMQSIEDHSAEGTLLVFAEHLLEYTVSGKKGTNSILGITLTNTKT